MKGHRPPRLFGALRSRRLLVLWRAVARLFGPGEALLGDSEWHVESALGKRHNRCMCNAKLDLFVSDISRSNIVDMKCVKSIEKKMGSTILSR